MDSDDASPGPGWSLGDDGHWKPPPFHVSAGLVVTADPAHDDEGGGRRRRRPPRDLSRARDGARRLARSTVVGVLALSGLVGAAAAGSSVYHGVRAQEDDPAPLDDLSEARERYQGEDAPEAAAVWGAVGNPDTICPTPEVVAATTGDDLATATYAYDRTTRLNGIPLFGPRCNYGEHVHVGAAAAPGDLVTWLRDSEGDYVVTDGPLDISSVTVTEPPDPNVEGRGAGSVRVVFQIGIRTYWVMVDTALEDSVDELAQVVRAQNT